MADPDPADDLDYEALSVALPPEVLEALDAFLRGDLEAHPPELAAEQLEAFLEGSWVDFSYHPDDFQGEDRSWFVTLSKTFLKAVNRLDRKIGRRVKNVIPRIAESPMTPRGNTVKPLGNALRGLWRYRLGGYRLIYRPDRESRNVLMMDIGSRGGIYDQA
ncbi:MAG: type II toxin-antitoxin system RelE/ParE family toxin [Proteobacteria bacterium]|nr:type II toxin-antitoxin system RelE/ParE family toxin [Pseudomonadota bacterium]